MKYSFRITLGCLVLLGIGGCRTEEHHEHGHHEHEEEIERGSHGGRLLKDGTFALELKIFESGVPPQYRIYAFEKGEQLSPDSLSATVTLSRLGRAPETISFIPSGDFLVSEQEIAEPHSFDVAVEATANGQKHSWQFSQIEGRTSIPDDVAKHSGIQTTTADGKVLRRSVSVRGKVTPSEHKIAHIIPRFAGVVREGRKHIGDPVEKGEVLAVIESNQSLQPFEVRSQISGTVINGHVIVGEFIPENEWIYIVADTSEVWVDFFIPLREQLSPTVGQKITLTPVQGKLPIEGRLSYVAPYADERSQSQLVRAVIPNPERKLLPGMFVEGELILEERPVHVAVPQSALQRFRDWNVVFRKVGEAYEATPIESGARDGNWVEILSGLEKGDEYVIENSFLLKADILKSAASHDH